jgi:phage shock protein A
MYGALFRWLKAVGYLLTGRMDAARRLLDTNPHVVRAKFDEIVRDKTARVQQYKQAVAALIAQQESKMAKVKALTEEVRNLENLKTGALAKARQRVARLQGQGRPKEDIQKDEEYMKCLSAYNDFSSTLTEKQARIAELETDIQEYSRRIGEHKVQLQALVREIEKVKAEAADTVADMITTREEKEIADTLSGIAEDGTAKELQRMRELRQEMKAEARISGELAGTDAKAQEAEFLDYARRTTASDEFEALVGLAAKTDAGARGEAAAPEKTREKLPE